MSWGCTLYGMPRGSEPKMLSDALVSRGTSLPFGGTPEQAIARLESAMRQFDLLEIEPVHYFAEGSYAREVTLPAGSLLISHTHLTRHVCICSKGAITVFQTDNGTRLIRAPFTFVSEPGCQRVGYVHEETVWTTFHATDTTDIEEIEKVLYFKHESAPCIEGDADLLAEWLLELPSLLELQP